ncbi:MAG: glycosyltransferase family 2 protein [Gracilibacteraceae bacterium]|jgi:glycosyltransferase involved in cell wall biosynthesis|nr:glycosyltransferase family 2 protein [Gracilibacteraceae bacterium]
MTHKKHHLDIITPCFNEQECVPLFFAEISRCMQGLDCSYSVLFIDDGSQDGTLAAIKSLVEKYGNESVKYISFARNFGKEAAIYAGLEASDGDLVVLMDCDLQHPPALLPAMLDEIDAGYDSCAAYRVERKGEPWLRKILSNAFFSVLNHISEVDMRPGVTDFRMMTRNMKDAVVSLREYERFSKGLFDWIGYKTKWIEYEDVQRAAGKTKWSFIALLKYAAGGLVAFSTTPLRLASVLGALVVLAAVVYSAFIILQVLVYGTDYSGFSTIIILIMFIGGVIISLLGIIGEYLARVYSEIKRRPIYITRETNIK